MKRYLPGLLLITILFSGAPPTSAQVTPGDFQHSGSISDGLRAPTRTAVDGNGDLWAIDGFRHEIRKYDPAGTLLGTFSTPGNPVSLATDGNNGIYYGIFPGGTLYHMDGNGQSTVFYSGCVFPNDMTAGPDHTLYITDSKLRKVLAVDATGQLVQTIGEGTLAFPTGIGYDYKNHRLLVGEHGATESSVQTRVYLYGTDGGLIDQIGMYGNGDGKFYRIQGVGSGRCGHIYVCDPFQSDVSVFKEDGTFLTRFGSFGTNPGELNVPMDVSFTEDYRVILASMNNDRLELFTVDDDLPSATITQLELMVCQGSVAEIPVSFTGTPPWTFTYTVDGLNPATVSGVTDNPYLLPAGSEGTYVVTALTDANEEGHCFSGSARVHFTEAPTALLGTAAATICEGSQLHVPVYLTGTPPWTLTCTHNGTSTFTITTPTNPGFLTLSQAGTYEITALSDALCEGSGFPGTLTLSLEPRPEPDFHYTSDALHVSFANLSLHAGTYLWNFGDNQVSTEASPHHLYPQAGFYTVRLIASNDYCKSAAITRIIEVRPDPDTAAIDLPYADKSTPDAIPEGAFRVALYPNPSNGQFSMEVSHASGGEITAELINITGQILFRERYHLSCLPDPSAPFSVRVILPETAAGVYTLKVLSGQQACTRRLVIQSFHE